MTGSRRSNEVSLRAARLRAKWRRLKDALSGGGRFTKIGMVGDAVLVLFQISGLLKMDNHTVIDGDMLFL